MCNTKLCGGVSGLREKTAPDKDDVMRYLRTEYQSSEFRCSRVFLSISQHLSDVILRVSLNCEMVSFSIDMPGML